jgi:Tfp pilus assembly protein PilF
MMGFRSQISIAAVVTITGLLLCPVSALTAESAAALSQPAAEQSSITPLERPAIASARKMFLNGDYKKATKTLEAAVKKEPQNSRLLDELGLAYERLAEQAAFPSRKQGQAETFFRRAITADSNNPGPLRHLITLLLQPPNQCRGNLEEVPKLIQKLSSVDARAGREAKQEMEWAAAEQQTFAERLVCAPHSAASFMRHLIP